MMTICSIRLRPVILSNAPRLGEQLCFALYAASNVLTRAYRSLLEPLDLTYPQFVVMMALWEKDGVSITYLAACTKLGMPTMTPLLKRLEEKKLLERNASPADDRQKLIVLTAEGAALAAQGETVTREAFRRTGLQPSEAKRLLDLCQQMIDRMETHELL
jgi:DNA-binding MarR family transcriptional regulator